MECLHIQGFFLGGQVYRPYEDIGGATSTARGADDLCRPHAGGTWDPFVWARFDALISQDKDTPSTAFPQLHCGVAYHMVSLLQLIAESVVQVTFAFQVVFLDANDLVFLLSHQKLIFPLETYPF